MDRYREFKFFTILLALAVLFSVSTQVASGDTFSLTGEKGFSFNYYSGLSFTDPLFWGAQGLGFSQSLILDVNGDFDSGYKLTGHLVDMPNASGQLSLELIGEHAGLKFGDGSLNVFSTPLEAWRGQYNGLEGYLKGDNYQVRLAYANPTGVPVRERLNIPSGRNYVYLNYQPVKEGSLSVRQEGRLLQENVDYLINYATGRLELLYFPANAVTLDTEYQFIPSEVLGNQFLAFSGRYTWGPFYSGATYFDSLTKNDNGPVMLGEMKRMSNFNLGGVNFGYQGEIWNWDAEYLSSQEKGKATDWDYIDNMEGTEVESEIFTGSNRPAGWMPEGSGFGTGNLGIIGPGEDMQHTRNYLPSLIVDYSLKQNGDSFGIRHDFGSLQDFRNISALNFWVFGNGQNVRMDVQIITSENNYFHYQVPVNALGWQQIAVNVNNHLLPNPVGDPDLSRIRYLKVVFLSGSGGASTGRLYLSAVTKINRNSAEQRWANVETSPGSSLDVGSGVDPVPVETNPNRVLLFNYNIVVTGSSGWVKSTYKPSVPFNLAGYRNLKVYLRASEQVRVSVIFSRMGTDYALPDFPTVPGGWQEYTISLDTLPKSILGSLESVSFQISNNVGSNGELRVDAFRAADRRLSAADALKFKGDYHSGPWNSTLEVNQTNPGFRDLTNSYLVKTGKIQNITQYEDGLWHVKTDLQSYQQPEQTNGYLMDGRRYGVEAGYSGTDVSYSQMNETIDPAASLVTGTRAETRWQLSQTWDEWKVLFENLKAQSTFENITEHNNDAVTLSYQPEYWWGKVQYWQDNAINRGADQSTFGNNYWFGYDPPGIDRIQLNGGMVYDRNWGGSISSSFWYTEMTYAPTAWIEIGGKGKSLYSVQPTKDNLTADRLYNLTLKITPTPAWSVKTGQLLRNWDETNINNAWQYTRDYQTSYDFNETERVGGFWRIEDLSYFGIRSSGMKYGFNLDLILKQPWLTQMAAEVNQNASNSLINIRQSGYKYSLKNSLRRADHLIYWGAWAEEVSAPEYYNRLLAQAGWEQQLENGWNFGTRLDVGREDTTLETGDFIWGSTDFISYNGFGHYFEANLTYQTYNANPWRITLDYKFFKDNIYSFNLHGDYQTDLEASDSFLLRADLIFYF